MKLTIRTPVLLAFVSVTLSAVAQTNQPATVHIYRTGSHSPAIKIFLDRQEAFKVGNHVSATFQLPAGKHEIAASYGDREPKVAVSLEAGKEYFFELALEVRMLHALAQDPAGALELELTRQSSILDPKAHERSLSPDRLAWIANLHSPVAPDPLAAPSLEEISAGGRP
jgi:hypothetical protein